MAGSSKERDLPLLYNGLVETATRSLLLLDACYPSSFTFDELRLLDLFVVFGEDIGYPSSLHVLLPGRARAHEFRPRAIRKGTDLLLALGCIESFEEDGIAKMRAADDALSLAGYVSSKYLSGIRETARWMNLRMDALGEQAFLDGLRSRLNELSDEEICIPSGTADRFSGLAAVYASDIVRLEGMEEAAWLLKYLRTSHEASTTGPLPEIVPTVEWFETVRHAAAREAISVRQQSTGLAEVVSTLP